MQTLQYACAGYSSLSRSPTCFRNKEGNMTKASYDKVIRLIYAYDRASDGSSDKKEYMKEIKCELKKEMHEEAGG